MYTKKIRGILGIFIFKTTPGITDLKLVKMELFEYKILKWLVVIYTNAYFLGALVFTLEVSKISYFEGILAQCNDFRPYPLCIVPKFLAFMLNWSEMG